MGRRKEGIDRLSGLPDEILYHILSFLSTKRSVCTSVLSKRWRFLWTHVPTLEFMGHNFTGRKKKHLDIINRVIMLHKAKIVNTFRLHYVKGPPYRFETLLIYPIMRGVRNLYLNFDFKHGCDIACTLPRLLLTCKTLVDLKLTNCGVIPSSGELFWPSLKKLLLSYVEYEDDKSLPHLLSGCPVLEELTIRDCFGKEEHYSGSVIVSSPTIKKLNVDFSHGGAYFPEKMLIIDVPAVTHLLVVSYDLECVKSLSKTMTSLIEAEITLVGDGYMCGFDCNEHGRSIEFLSSLCHVRYLQISTASDEMSFDMVGTGSMPEFENLIKLELDWTVNWRHLVKFLEVADNLEVLFVRDCLYKEPKQVPPCMLTRLRTVRMHYFNSCEDAFDMVKFILRNARVLEAMEFFHVASDEEKLIARERISSFERVSKTCQLAFNNDEIVKFMLDKIRPKQILVFEPPF